MENIKEKINKALQSKTSTKVLYGIGIIIVAMIIFSAGINVGFHKASYGRNWGENYSRNFGMGAYQQNNEYPRRGNMMGSYFGGGMMGFPNSHGAVGKIIKLELPNIIVLDKDNLEKTILIKDDAKIQKATETLKSSDLKVDDFIVVIGTPNDTGVIEAKFIRIMPAPQLLK